MVRFYAARVRSGRMAIEDVPELWRDKVAAELAG